MAEKKGSTVSFEVVLEEKKSKRAPSAKKRELGAYSVTNLRELESKQNAAEERRKKAEKEAADRLAEKKAKAEKIRAKAEKIKAETPRDKPE